MFSVVFVCPQEIPHLNWEHILWYNGMVPVRNKNRRAFPILVLDLAELDELD